jgi:hypothetical protein
MYDKIDFDFVEDNLKAAVEHNSKLLSNIIQNDYRNNSSRTFHPPREIESEKKGILKTEKRFLFV